MLAPIPRLTSLLFTPALRTERYQKVPACGADGIIIDLEDSVPLSEKSGARDGLIDWLKAHQRVGALPFITALRINDLRSSAGRADLDALNAAAIRVDAVVLPKVESAAEVQQAARRLFGAPRLICMIETVLGVRFAAEIASSSPQVAALAFGGFDLSAETGGEPTWDSLLWPRTQVVHAASAAGVVAIDQPFIDLGDIAALTQECTRVRALGFAGKLAIHPQQCPVIKSAFLPTKAQLTEARRIVEAFSAAQGNVAVVDGRMIDVPMYRSAQRVLQSAGDAAS